MADKAQDLGFARKYYKRKRQIPRFVMGLCQGQSPFGLDPATPKGHGVNVLVPTGVGMGGNPFEQTAGIAND